MASNQRDRILAYLKRGRSITQETARNNFGCWRLAPRILELRQAGYPIETKLAKSKDGTRFARYYLSLDWLTTEREIAEAEKISGRPVFRT